MLYVILANFTDQGIRDAKNLLKRAKAFRTMAETKFGVKVKEILWTLGAFDVIVIVDAPDEKSSTALSLALASLGNVKTQTLRAFNADELKDIIAKIS